jgi:hypothetical protein
MVQDVSDLDDDTYLQDDNMTPFTPGSNNSTPGLSLYGGDDYFGPRDDVTVSGRKVGRRQSSLTSTRLGRGSGSGHGNTLGVLNATGQGGGGKREKRTRKPLARLHTEVLLKMVLQDAQTRLVFRAQALLQAEVQYYAPKEGDLDYPEKLSTSECLPLSWSVQRRLRVFSRHCDHEWPPSTT